MKQQYLKVDEIPDLVADIHAELEAVNDHYIGGVVQMADVFPKSMDTKYQKEYTMCYLELADSLQGCFDDFAKMDD